uniref:Putative secreted protein n=1 Tax=Anopheles marajoara TaxID=58244 RepID=A0A2M4C5H0_9DIPT
MLIVLILFLLRVQSIMLGGASTRITSLERFRFLRGVPSGPIEGRNVRPISGTIFFEHFHIGFEPRLDSFNAIHHLLPLPVHHGLMFLLPVCEFLLHRRIHPLGKVEDRWVGFRLDKVSQRALRIFPQLQILQLGHLRLQCPYFQLLPLAVSEETLFFLAHVLPFDLFLLLELLLDEGLLFLFGLEFRFFLGELLQRTEQRTEDAPVSGTGPLVRTLRSHNLLLRRLLLDNAGENPRLLVLGLAIRGSREATEHGLCLSYGTAFGWVLATVRVPPLLIPSLTTTGTTGRLEARRMSFPCFERAGTSATGHIVASIWTTCVVVVPGVSRVVVLVRTGRIAADNSAYVFVQAFEVAPGPI